MILLITTPDIMEQDTISELEISAVAETLPAVLDNAHPANLLGTNPPRKILHKILCFFVIGD